MRFNYVQLYVIINFVSDGMCWQYFRPLSDVILTNSPPDKEHIHSEYRYGHCNNKNLKFFEHVHLDHLDVLGKVIVRGWLDLNRIPTCIIVRGTSYEIDLFRSTAYGFQICVPRIGYCHTQRRWIYHYYEWYIPPDMIGGMNWDLYFFGRPGLGWV